MNVTGSSKVGAACHLCVCVSPGEPRVPAHACQRALRDPYPRGQRILGVGGLQYPDRTITAAEARPTQHVIGYVAGRCGPRSIGVYAKRDQIMPWVPLLRECDMEKTPSLFWGENREVAVEMICAVSLVVCG